MREVPLRAVKGLREEEEGKPHARRHGFSDISGSPSTACLYMAELPERGRDDVLEERRSQAVRRVVSHF